MVSSQLSKVFLPFSFPLLTFPVLVRFFSIYLHKIRDFGAQGLISCGCFSRRFLLPAIFFLSFSLFPITSFDREGVGMCMLVWRVSLFLVACMLTSLGFSGVLFWNLIHSHVLALPNNSVQWTCRPLLRGFYFSSKGLRLLWFIVEFCMG